MICLVKCIPLRVIVEANEGKKRLRNLNIKYSQLLYSDQPLQRITTWVSFSVSNILHTFHTYTRQRVWTFETLHESATPLQTQARSTCNSARWKCNSATPQQTSSVLSRNNASRSIHTHTRTQMFFPTIDLFQKHPVPQLRVRVSLLSTSLSPLAPTHTRLTYHNG